MSVETKFSFRAAADLVDGSNRMDGMNVWTLIHILHIQPTIPSSRC